MQMLIVQFGSSEDGVQTVLPAAAELFWVALVVVVLVLGLIAVIVFIARRSSTGQTAEVETWRDRALKAEAERDLLRDLVEDELGGDSEGRPV